jgi:two-component sensor histidine kinase
MILVGILFPLVANMIDLEFLYPLNLTQMAFSIAVIPLTWGVMRLQIGDVLPVARRAIFEGMNDGVIVLDRQSQIIDVNAAAAAMLARPEKELRGQAIELVWGDGRFLKNIGQPIAGTWLRPTGRLYQPEKMSVAGREAAFKQEGQQKVYDVRISPLVDWRNYIISLVIVFRDITQRVQAERLIQKAKEELEAKVTERTNELRQANVKLQHELIERQQAEIALKQAHNELEQRVTERTAELAQINEQLTFELVERKRAEEKIQISLREKDVLLKEIHHRVKNNLQVISSMLNLQSGYLDDEAVLTMLQDSKNRVRSMALIHEKLYQSDNLALVDFSDYIENLATYLVRFYNNGHVHLKIDAEPVYLGIDTAVPCGLILNELISNSLKHAFPNGHAGQITVSLRKAADNQVNLIIADDGVGLPRDLEIFSSPSLGLQLVHALVGQLDGDLQIDQTNGVSFAVRCRMKENTLS